MVDSGKDPQTQPYCIVEHFVPPLCTDEDRARQAIEAIDGFTATLSQAERIRGVVYLSLNEPAYAPTLSIAVIAEFAPFTRATHAQRSRNRAIRDRVAAAKVQLNQELGDTLTTALEYVNLDPKDRTMDGMVQARLADWRKDSLEALAYVRFHRP